MGERLREPGPVRRLYWRLRRIGLTDQEAGRLLMFVSGMVPNEFEWTEAQVALYLLLKEGHREGRFER